MHDEKDDVGDSHNEDPFSRDETWEFIIDELGNAKGKRVITFHNSTNEEPPLHKRVELDFDKPASDVKLEGSLLTPIPTIYNGVKTVTYKKYAFDLNETSTPGSEITKTIDFTYDHFATKYSKYTNFKQILHEDVLNSAISIRFFYQLPKRCLGRFSYIVDFNKGSRLQYDTKNQRFTCLQDHLPFAEVDFIYAPTPVYSILLFLIAIIIIIIASLYTYINGSEKLGSIFATNGIAIACSVIASYLIIKR